MMDFILKVLTIQLSKSPERIQSRIAFMRFMLKIERDDYIMKYFIYSFES